MDASERELGAVLAQEQDQHAIRKHNELICDSTHDK